MWFSEGELTRATGHPWLLSFYVGPESLSVNQVRASLSRCYLITISPLGWSVNRLSRTAQLDFTKFRRGGHCIAFRGQEISSIMSHCRWHDYF